MEVIRSLMTYLFYDVETPNRHNDRISSVGWVLVEDERPVASGCQLIDPKAEFDPFNVRFTGIHPEDVEGMPTFGEYWTSTLGAMMTSSVIVAHSAPFDVSVTTKALKSENITPPELRYIDTLEVFTRLRPDGRCKLHEIATDYGIIYDEHRAASDARALADVCMRAVSRGGLHSLDDLLGKPTTLDARKQARREKQRDRVKAQMAQYQQEKNAEALSYVISEEERGRYSTRCGLPAVRNLSDPDAGYREGSEFYYLGERLRSLGQEEDALILLNHARAMGYQYGVLYESYCKIYRARRDYEQELILIDEYLSRSPSKRERPLFEDRREKTAALLQRQQAAIQTAHEAEEARRLKAEQKAQRQTEKTEAAARRTPQTRSVIQMDQDGSDLAVYPSVASAAGALGISTKVIRDAAIGKQKTAGGFRWRYADEATDQPSNEVTP